MRGDRDRSGCTRGLAGALVWLAVAGIACGDDDGAAADAGELDQEPQSGGGGDLDALQLTVGELVFDARAAGPGDGDLVILLHGFPTTWYQWRAQLTALADAGYRAVAPNQRGYSDGARPEDVESYAVSRLAQDVLGMADELGRDTFHVVGHDWGGAVAWTVAGTAPARVESLSVLSTPHPDALSAALADPDSCQADASAYFEILANPDVTPQDLGSIGVGFDGVPQDAQTLYIQTVITQPDAFAAATNWYAANVSEGMLAAGVGTIRVPTLYLFGTDDGAVCRDTAEASGEYVEGDYQFVPIEGGGHWLSEADPEIVSEKLLEHIRANTP